MKKILFACSDLNSRGGIQRFNRNLVAAWEAKGYSVDIVSLIDSDSGAIANNSTLYGCDGNRIKWILKVRALVKNNRYEADVCGHINLAVAFQLVMLTSFKLNRNTSLVLHGIEVWDRIKALKKIFYALFQNIMSVSQYTLESYRKQMKSVHKSNEYIFPNTINQELYDVDASRKMHGDTETKSAKLLSVSRLSKMDRNKGVLHVIESLLLLPKDLNYKYRVIGNGDDLEYLREYVLERGLKDHVTFLGSLDDDEMWDEYRSADIFVLPSSKEGFGIVFLEAMYFKLPVICAAEKGAAEVIKNDINGYLVEFGNISQISDRILRLIKNDKLRNKLGSRGKKMVERDGKFGFNTFADRAFLMFVKQKSSFKL